jgi:hypothetical protein
VAAAGTYRAPRALQPPASLRAAYRAELRLAFAAPYALLLALALNAALVSICWWFLPKSINDWLFSLHANWAFPIALGSWMISDGVATNVFGNDAKRMALALRDPAALRHELYAKDLVMATLVVPPCILLGIALDFHRATDARAAIGFLIIVLMPFAGLGIASWLGAVVPYHPIPLRHRWQRRRELGWRNVRWACASVTPYFVVGPLTVIAFLPMIIFWAIADGANRAVAPPVWVFILGAPSAVALAAAMWVGGNRVTLRLAARRKERLLAYLADPALG